MLCLGKSMIKYVPRRNSCVHTHSSNVSNSKTLETIQMPIKSRMNKTILEYYSAVKINAPLLHTSACMSVTNKL